MANFNFDPSFFMQAYLNSNRQGWQSGENQQDRAQRDRLQRQEIEAQAQRQAEIMANQRRMQSAGFGHDVNMADIGYGHQRGLIGLTLQGDLEKMYRNYGYDLGKMGYGHHLQLDQMAVQNKYDVENREDTQRFTESGANELITTPDGRMMWVNRFRPQLFQERPLNMAPPDLFQRAAEFAPEWGKKLYGGLLGGVLGNWGTKAGQWGDEVGGAFGQALGDFGAGAVDLLGLSDTMELNRVNAARNQAIARENEYRKKGIYFNQPTNPWGL